MDIIWFSKKAKANYELKPEDYDFCTDPDLRLGELRVYHKSGQYVGYVSMCGCGFPKYDCHCAELMKMTPEEQRLWWASRPNLREEGGDR